MWRLLGRRARLCRYVPGWPLGARGDLPRLPEGATARARNSSGAPLAGKSVDFRALATTEEILAVANTGDSIAAFFHLGKRARGTPEFARFRQDDRFVRLCNALRRREMSPAGISNVVLGMSYMTNDAAQLGSLLDSVLATVKFKAASFTSQETAMTLNALARLDHRDDELLSTFCGEAVRKVGRFNSQGIANTLNALARLDHRDDELLSTFCGEAVRKVGRFNSQGIANTLNALARLDHRDDELLSTFCGEAVRKVGSFNSQEIAMTRNALAKFDHSDDELLSKLAATT